MSELLKEPKPSMEARGYADDRWCRGVQPAEYAADCYKIDVAPLIAEIDRLRTSNGQLHADLFGMQDGALLQDLRAYIERLTKERDAFAESMRNFESVWQIERAQVDCLTHQNVALVEALTKIRDQPIEHSDRITAYGVKWAFYYMQEIAAGAIAQLDAPQPDARDAAIAEAVRMLRKFSYYVAGKGDHAAARAFVEKHDNGSAAAEKPFEEMTEEELLAGLEALVPPQPNASPVTDEEVDALYLAIGKYFNPLAANADIKSAVRAALEAFVKNRSGK